MEENKQCEFDCAFCTHKCYKAKHNTSIERIRQQAKNEHSKEEIRAKQTSAIY